jgi:putative ABC transport system permease protein
MKTIIIAFRSIFRRGRNGLIRIASLSVGLAVALALVAKVYFEQSYDSFTPDVERVYRVQANYKSTDGDKSYSQTSGAVVVGMKDVMPEVEAATRFTFIGDNSVLRAGENKYTGDIILGDTSLFDILARPILAGDAKETLARPMYAMVSSEMAQRMGGVGQAVGKTFRIEDRPGKTITIGGVFEAIPKNSHMAYDVVISLASISEFTWDGSLNWLGNDRYISYVKLSAGAKEESVADGIERVKEKYLDKARLSQSGVEIDYTLMPLDGLHTSDKDVRQSMWLLGVLAFALLFTAVMNYLLIVISSLVNRSKEMAVHKCYGASGRNIYARMMAETLADLLVSLAICAALIYTFRDAIASLLGANINDLFTLQSCLLLAAVCAIVFLVSSLAPGYLYARIPVAAAFRRFSDSKRRWKLGLLCVQFIAAGFFVTLLAIVGKQYNYMTANDPGYEYENIAYCSLSGLNAEQRGNVLEEMLRLPETQSVTSADYLPLEGFFSGNNVRLPGDERDLFNIADLYSVGSNYFEVMGIRIAEGRTFTEGAGASREVMVSRSFVERMQAFADWTDGVVGKSVYISEHSRGKDETFTICGVYDDVRLGVIGSQDNRPSAMFRTSGVAGNIIVKLHSLTPEAVATVSERLASLLPDKTVNVYSYPSEMVNRYGDSRKFRDSIMTAGLATLLISLMGLLGYTNDEMNRRRKETAIRKINGATSGEILRLYLAAVLRMALPALTIGCAVAWYVSEGWLERFDDKAALPVILFLAAGTAVLAVIITTAALNCYRAANENPALNIKSE